MAIIAFIRATRAAPASKSSPSEDNRPKSSPGDHFVPADALPTPDELAAVHLLLSAVSRNAMPRTRRSVAQACRFDDVEIADRARTRAAQRAAKRQRQVDR